MGVAFSLHETPQITQLGVLESIVGKHVSVFDETHLTKFQYIKFKTMVTNNRVNLRAMWMSNKEVANPTKFIVLTNTESPFEKQVSSERRFPLFRASVEQMKDENYFNELYRYSF